MTDRIDNATDRPGQDVRNLAILLTVAVTVGVCVLVQTALISRDGVNYIFYAQQLQRAPLEVLSDPAPEVAPPSYTPGYPFLILCAHTVGRWFGAGASVAGWAMSAQIVSLVCRVLAVIPLYLIAKRVVGARMSFWGMVILSVLPYPARFAADALRDWPALLALATAFALLCRAARTGRLWWFGASGVVAGLGYSIRPVCGQIVAYALLWSLWRIRRPIDGWAGRGRVLASLALLVMGFALTAGPVMVAMGRVVPISRPIVQAAGPATVQAAGLMPHELLDAMWALVNKTSEMLMYYFVPALLVGVASLRREVPPSEDKRLLGMFLAGNVAILLLRHCLFGHTLSERYLLPLAAVGAPVIALGIHTMTASLLRALRREVTDRSRRVVFIVLVAVGVGICLPKLLRPVRPDKARYITAGRWLAENTPTGCRIAVPDWRIGFYAEREFSHVWGVGFPVDCDYVVKIYAPGQKWMLSPDFPRLHTIELHDRKSRTIVVYEVAANAGKWQGAE